MWLSQYYLIQSIIFAEKFPLPDALKIFGSFFTCNQVRAGHSLSEPGMMKWNHGTLEGTVPLYYATVWKRT
jgi:hypothetical protein